jgi:hypothetical protein
LVQLYLNRPDLPRILLTVFVLIVLHGFIVDRIEVLQTLQNEGPKGGDIVEVPDSRVVYLIEILTLIEEPTAKGPLLRPGNVALAL